MSSAAHRVILGLSLLVWAGIVLNLAIPFPTPWDAVLRWFGLGIAIVHGLELLMFRGLLGAGGNSKALDSLLILAAGAFHASWLARERVQRSAVKEAA